MKTHGNPVTKAYLLLYDLDTIRTLGNGTGTVDIYTVRDYQNLDAFGYGTLTGIENIIRKSLMNIPVQVMCHKPVPVPAL